MRGALAVVCILTASARADSVRGVIRTKSDGQPAAGATLILTPSPKGAREDQVAITDETGTYAFDVEPGTYDLVVYYVDASIEIAKGLVIGGDLTLGSTTIDDSRFQTGCVFWSEPSPDISSAPRFGFAATREFHPVSRDRTHRAWIAPVASANPSTSVTQVEDGPRLARSPGIPVAFLEEVTTHTLRVPFDQLAGTGGATEIALRSGSNEGRGEARTVLGLDRPGTSGGAEMFASGPLVRDHAWIAAGLVAQRDASDALGSDAMVHAHFMPSFTHVISVAGIGHASGDTDRAGWANAKWVVKLLDARVELRTTATAETMTLPETAVARATTPTEIGGTVDRISAGSTLKLRIKAAGYHQLVAGAGGGAGTRGADPHSDASFVIGDEWQLRPNLTISAGTVSEFRRYDGARTWVTAPRASITLDPTKEGRSDVFLAYQRVSHLDDGLPGDWREPLVQGHALVTDEISTGVSYIRASWPQLMAGIATRARLPEANGSTTRELDIDFGVDAWVRIDRGTRTSVLAQATTLGRVATLLAQHTLVRKHADSLVGGATLRATPDRSDVGGVVTWRHSGSGHAEEHQSDLSFDLGLEAHGGTDGPGGRLLLGLIW